MGRYHLHREHSFQFILRSDAKKGGGDVIVGFQLSAGEINHGAGGLAQKTALKRRVFSPKCLLLPVRECFFGSLGYLLRNREYLNSVRVESRLGSGGIANGGDGVEFWFPCQFLALRVHDLPPECLFCFVSLTERQD